MKKTLRTLGSSLINHNQFFQYGRTWFNIPFNLLAVASQVGVLLLYLDLEQKNNALITLTGIIILVIYLSGRLLFNSGGQQADRIMSSWRTPAHALVGVSLWYSTALIAEKMEIPVPQNFNDFGITEWRDIGKICDYILEYGRRAGAVPLSRRLMGVE